MSASKNKSPGEPIVIGVDPAPSKGLCVYAHAHGSSNLGENCGFKKHYGTTELEDFTTKINNLAKIHPVLICWDAPLTVPHESNRFYTREIEAIWIRGRANRKGKTPESETAWASVQGFAGCSHWAITQRILGFPSLDNNSLAGVMLKNTTLIYEEPVKPKEFGNSVYIIEVHPALAMQVALGSKKVNEFKSGGRLSGAGSYKKVSWTKFDKAKKNNVTDGFKELLKNVKKEFIVTTGDVDFLPNRSGTGDKTNPSDHLDAWVAMQLGRMCLDGKARIYGNERLGSFLLKVSENVKIESEIIAKIEEMENRKGDRALIHTPPPPPAAS